MQVLLTGANGFLGRFIKKSLETKADLITLGTNFTNDIICDLSDSVPEIAGIELVIHAAGRAHIVPKSESEKDMFFKVNVDGTKNLLKALASCTELKTFIFISSVAVYGKTSGTNIKEDEPLLAKDAYGESKILAEEIIKAWCTSRKVNYYILRLPLIAGSDAPGNLGAMVKGIKTGRYLSIGNANAKKSIVLAKDVASFVSSIQGPSGVYNLTDGYHPTFKELEQKIAGSMHKGTPKKIPILIAKFLGFAGDILGKRFPINSDRLNKITSTLTFDDTKARTALNWSSKKVLEGWNI